VSCQSWVRFMKLGSTYQSALCCLYSSRPMMFTIMQIRIECLGMGISSRTQSQPLGSDLTHVLFKMPRVCEHTVVIWELSRLYLPYPNQPAVESGELPLIHQHAHVKHALPQTKTCSASASHTSMCGQTLGMCRLGCSRFLVLSLTHMRCFTVGRSIDYCIAHPMTTTTTPHFAHGSASSLLNCRLLVD